MNKQFISRTSRHFLLIIAFISGFSIMAMEIAAARLLAPYFGTSMFVWANIIGIVLISLSAGYYIGGRLADRLPRLEILLRLILVAGMLFLIIPWVIKPLTSFIDLSVLITQPGSIVIIVSSFISAVILFAPPLLILGMVSPFIIKLYSLSLEGRIGESVGVVFAVSTVGSIMGTFLPTFFLIPFLGTKATINIFAIILIIIGSLGIRKIKLHVIVFITILPLIIYSSAAAIKSSPDLIFEDESAYHYIRVTEDQDGVKYLTFNEGGGIQSVYHSNSIMTGMYYDYFSALPFLFDSDDTKKTLIIGLAGGTIANQLRYFFPEKLEIEGVEIDRKVIDVAQRFFGLNDYDVKIYNQDGRIFLRNTFSKYNLIIIDAYQQELYIPWTLTTQEFWELVNARLTKDGIVAINVNSVSRESDLLKIISNTMASVFNNTYITELETESFNYLIASSQNQLDFELLYNIINDSELKELAIIIFNQTEKVKYNEELMILTDNHAPIEFMTDAMVINYIKDFTMQFNSH